MRKRTYQSNRGLWSMGRVRLGLMVGLVVIAFGIAFGVSRAPANGPTSSATGSISEIVRRDSPSVVGVLGYPAATTRSGLPGLTSSDVGTGVLFAKDANYGYFVTNQHVVSGANKLEVVMHSGRHIVAALAGVDPITGLAVLKVPVRSVVDARPLSFADSDKVQAGQPAIAMGIPVGSDFALSVTSGIISAPHRFLPVKTASRTPQTTSGSASTFNVPLIQTDAAINPGNSGGPLLNLHGEAVGINTSKIVQPGYEGMGFAIPSNLVETTARQIIRMGQSAESRRIQSLR